MAQIAKLASVSRRRAEKIPPRTRFDKIYYYFLDATNTLPEGFGFGWSLNNFLWAPSTEEEADNNATTQSPQTRQDAASGRDRFRPSGERHHSNDALRAMYAILNQNEAERQWQMQQPKTNF